MWQSVLSQPKEEKDNSMKICLINPPVLADTLVGKTKSMRKVVNIIPSLGLGYIAAVLLQNGFQVKIIDCSLGMTHSQLLEVLKIEKPDVVGITATTPVFLSMKQVAEDVKRQLPSTLVVAGGVHLTAAAEHTMGFDCFDIGVVGELGVLMSSRGCPSNCTFCDRAIFGSTFRQRSTDNVIQEIEELIYKFGAARELRFFDDTFTLNKN